MKNKLDIYIKENYVRNKFRNKIRNKFVKSFCSISPDEECAYSDISDFIDNNKNENRFQTLLFRYIDEKKMRDSDVYNKVHIDRRLFSKIRSDVNYHPSKETVILLALALELDIDELINLLNSASYSLPMNNHFDLIIRFCFIENIYDVVKINEMLDSYNCKLLGY